MPRRWPFETGQVYHVFNKSIFRFVIFNNQYEYQRMIDLMCYYQFDHDDAKKFSRYSLYLKRNNLSWDNEYFKEKERLVDVLAYCFMPTHVHFALKQNKVGGIQVFMKKVLNGYSRYFNLRYDRKGPLWQNRFKDVLVEGDDHLDRLLDYIHENPVEAKLVKKATDWPYSSAYVT